MSGIGADVLENCSMHVDRRRRKQWQYVPAHGNDSIKLTDLCSQNEFDPLGYLLQGILAVPASSAPVERVFSNSGLIVSPNRANLSDFSSRWFLPSLKLQVASNSLSVSVEY